MINIKDQKTIKNYCKVQLEAEEQIRIKSIARLLEEHYALYEILEYIIKELGIDKKDIWRGTSLKYTSAMTSQHIVLCNDLYFNNCYLHQYIISKGFNIPMEQVQQYVIHHIKTKADNSINDLFPFYDIASHIIWHGLLKKEIDINIKEFSFDYVNGLLEHTTDESEVIKIEKYLKLLKKIA